MEPEIETDDDYYQGFYPRQTEQKTAPQMASRRGGDSSHDAVVTRVVTRVATQWRTQLQKMKVLIIKQLAHPYIDIDI